MSETKRVENGKRGQAPAPVLTESECVFLDAQNEVLSTVDRLCQSRSIDDLYALMRANERYAEERRKATGGFSDN